MRLILIISFFIVFFSSAQDVDVVYQSPFEDGIESILVSPDRKHYISTEGHIETFGGLTIKLWDFKSKLLIKQKWFQSENGPGSGQVELFDEGILFISLNQSIIKVNLISNHVDTVFRVEHPEYIHDYTKMNANSLIIATKSYGDKHEEIDDVTDLGALYSLDLKAGMIISKRTYDFEFTFLQTEKKKNYFLAGTNKGACFFMNARLEEIREPVQLYNKSAVRFLAISDDSLLISNAALGEKKYVKWVGLGEVKLYDLGSDESLEPLTMDYTDAPDHDFLVEKEPSNLVKELFYNENTEDLIISYGYSSILSYNIKSKNKDVYNLVNSNEVIYSLIPTIKDDEFFIIHGQAKMFFESYNQFSLIDLSKDKLIQTIKNKKEALTNDSKYFQIENDYYLMSKTNTDGYSFLKQDTLLIRNKTLKPKTVVICKECEIEINESNSTWTVINDYKGVVIVKPRKSILNRDTLILSIGKSFTTNEIELNNANDLQVISQLNYRSEIFKKKRIGQFLVFSEKHNCSMVLLEKGNYDKPRQYLTLLDELGAVIDEVEIERFALLDLAVSPDQNTIVISEYGNGTTFHVFNNNNKVWKLTTTKSVTSDITSMQVTKDGTKIVIQYSGESEDPNFELTQFDLPNFTNQKTLHSGLYYETFFIDFKHNKLYNYDGDYLYRIDLLTNEFLDKIKASSSSGLSFYPNLNQVLFRFKIKNIQFNLGENSYVQTYLFENNELHISSKIGYYLSQGNQHENFGFAIDKRAYPFSQFDLIYNRPDIIINELGVVGVDEVSSYKKAYQKRLQKMNFTEEKVNKSFHFPVIEIVNNNENSFQTDLFITSINIKATDSKYPLDRINVWINNVPIYGVNGISLRDKNTQDYKTEIELQLNEGDNKIEVSVLNQAGAESYKETVSISCTKPAPKPNLYFVGIGVKDYVNEDMNLKYSDKDIRDVANLYGSSNAYGKVYIDTFLNVSATKNILPQIRQKLESTTIHDQVIFMYSGHGVLDDSLDYYLTTHDIDFLNPSTKGIPYEAVDELLDNIPARQKLVLIDACNSGEVDKDEMEVDNTTGITAEVIAPKGDMFKKYATKTNSFEMMQELFTDLRRGTGATVISSSSGKYFSFEDKKYQNGVYTYALKLGLEGAADTNRDKEITVTELKEYLYTKVESLTNGKQKPTARQENLEYDFRVW